MIRALELLRRDLACEIRLAKKGFLRVFGCFARWKGEKMVSDGTEEEEVWDRRCLRACESLCSRGSWCMVGTDRALPGSLPLGFFEPVNHEINPRRGISRGQSVVL